MTTYLYDIINSTGKKVTGEIEAKDKNELISNLQRDGYTVIHVEEKAKIDFKSLFKIDLTGVPAKDKMFFMKQFAIMVGTGIPIVQALEVLQKQTKNFTMKSLLSEVMKDVQEGSTLSYAFEKHKGIFSEVQINLLAAGESSGKLPEVIAKITSDIERDREFVNKVRGAMIYPVVILVVVVIVVILLMIFMIPEMTKLFQSFNAKLPPLTQTMVDISNFLNPSKSLGGVITAIIILITVFYVRSYRKTPSGRLVTDKIFMKIPVFGNLYKNLDYAQFTRILGMLLSSGVNITEALSITRGAVGNAVMKDAITRIVTQVEKGVPVAVSMYETEAFENILVYIIDTGERTGKLDTVLTDMANYYEIEVRNTTDNLSKLMEPFILVIVAIMVGVLALAVYLPIFQVATLIK